MYIPWIRIHTFTPSCDSTGWDSIRVFFLFGSKSNSSNFLVSLNLKINSRRRAACSCVNGWMSVSILTMHENLHKMKVCDEKTKSVLPPKYKVTILVLVNSDHQIFGQVGPICYPVQTSCNRHVAGMCRFDDPSHVRLKGQRIRFLYLFIS